MLQRILFSNVEIFISYPIVGCQGERRRRWFVAACGDSYGLWKGGKDV